MPPRASPLPSGARCKKAVSDRFISAATACIHSAAAGEPSTHTAAGLPLNASAVKASTTCSTRGTATLVAAILQVLDILQERVGGIGFDCRHLEGGAGLYQKTGTAFSAERMAVCKNADALLFGAVVLRGVRYRLGT